MAASGLRVAVVGSGGNIGSALVPLLARTPSVQSLLLVDPDRYEVHNLLSQDLGPSDVGKLKVRVQERRVKKLRPDLDIETAAVRVEELPLGRLRADVLVSCPDNLGCRDAVSRASHRLGVPWLDGGVRPSDGLARVTLRRPAPTAPCLFCSLDEGARDRLAVRQSCQDGSLSEEATSTRGTAGLGSLCASLLVTELENVISGACGESSREILVDARHRSLHVSALVRDPSCTFDHEAWEIEPLASSPGQVTFLDLRERARVVGREPVLSLHGLTLSTGAQCRGCGRACALLRIAERGTLSACPQCGGDRVHSGWTRHEELDLSDLSPVRLRTRLSNAGFLPADVLSLGGAHFELAAPTARGRSRDPSAVRPRATIESVSPGGPS
jgi:molybdopterin/thiamine biosynthesis adenylyltransferase